ERPLADLGARARASVAVPAHLQRNQGRRAGRRRTPDIAPLRALSDELLVLHQSDRAANRRADLHPQGLKPARGKHAPRTARASRTRHGHLSRRDLWGVLVHDRNPGRSGADLPARGAVAKLTQRARPSTVAGALSRMRLAVNSEALHSVP